MPAALYPAPGFLHLDSWAGRSRNPVTVLGETAQRFRVRLESSLRLPSKRWGQAGDVVLVPKYAVTLAPKE